MKKTILILPMIAGVIILMINISCGPQQPNPQLVKNAICSNYSNDNISKLPVGLVRDMVDKYEGGQLSKINEGVIDDAEAIWFDLETLKKFLYHIENITKQKDNSITSANLGVRIYYTSYPSRNNWNNYGSSLNGLDSRYENKHTLIMVPTINRDGIDMNLDYNPSDSSTYGKGIKGLSGVNRSRYYDNNNRNETSILGLTVLDSRNHGGLFPPKKMDGLAFKQ